MRKTNHPSPSISQKGLPTISNPSSPQFVAGQLGNNSDNKKKKKQHNPEGFQSRCAAEDGIDKDLDELSNEEWFQTGVEFVLSLERSCLSHISSAQPSGHAVSTQDTLLKLAPPTLNNDLRWQVSAEGFEKLFEMANKLDLNGYITPIQAWNRIRDHENFPRLTRERLKTLQNAMRPHVKCQEFAALMDEAIFEVLLNKALGP